MITYSNSYAKPMEDEMQQVPSSQGKKHIIGIAEYKIAIAPDKIVTLGLGSCVGLILYDSISKTAGMVHIMLPVASKNIAVFNKFKFADTAVTELKQLMIKSGRIRGRLTAKLAGGAHMFNTTYNTDIMNVGERNVQVSKEHLRAHAIAIAAEDIGGTSGRSIEFDCETGLLQVRTVAPKNIQIL